jgi:hypothetical protein
MVADHQGVGDQGGVNRTGPGHRASGPQVSDPQYLDRLAKRLAVMTALPNRDGTIAGRAMVAAARVLRPARLTQKSVFRSAAGVWARRPVCQGRADIVAKRFWESDEATLIQDQPTIRKVDSKTCSAPDTARLA